MSDWWSVGIIIYQLMNMETPFVFPKGSFTDDGYREESDRLVCTKKIEFTQKGI